MTGKALLSLLSCCSRTEIDSDRLSTLQYSGFSEHPTFLCRCIAPRFLRRRSPRWLTLEAIRLLHTYTAVTTIRARVPKNCRRRPLDLHVTENGLPLRREESPGTRQYLTPHIYFAEVKIDKRRNPGSALGDSSTDSFVIFMYLSAEI